MEVKPIGTSGRSSVFQSHTFSRLLSIQIKGCCLLSIFQLGWTNTPIYPAIRLVYFVFSEAESRLNFDLVQVNTVALLLVCLFVCNEQSRRLSDLRHRSKSEKNNSKINYTHTGSTLLCSMETASFLSAFLFLHSPSMSPATGDRVTFCARQIASRLK